MFEWVNDDYVCGTLSQGQKTNRQEFLEELNKLIKGLKDGTASIDSVLDKLNQVEQVIVKRLEWASAANPTLNEISKSFESARNKRNKIYSNEKKLAVMMEFLLRMWHDFEIFRMDKSELYQELKSSFDMILNE